MYTNCAVNEIPETFSVMMFGVDISKFHVSSYVRHVKCLSEVKLTEIFDQDVKWNLLGSNNFFQDSFYYCLIFLL